MECEYVVVVVADSYPTLNRITLDPVVQREPNTTNRVGEVQFQAVFSVNPIHEHRAELVDPIGAAHHEIHRGGVPDAAGGVLEWFYVCSWEEVFGSHRRDRRRAVGYCVWAPGN
ncbi:hypothetical protein GCM10009745_01420 [Kribbella yunnanensis]|uniref:Uncharacterized protein n=1 Tax=Kribbella yunnanensis TaxID=190194 RepID=A0ABP4RWY1_9ACTN